MSVFLCEMTGSNSHTITPISTETGNFGGRKAPASSQNLAQECLLVNLQVRPELHRVPPDVECQIAVDCWPASPVDRWHQDGQPARHADSLVARLRSDKAKGAGLGRLWAVRGALG
ncbi:MULTISPECIES: hypothetical protein [unclassified Streptomyces]|uniref:hypothetical protein n=1 Tax=unclassified Streptomyces TaxID=2593676 RepID=UPI00116554F8|nr:MULTISPECIES: hypothetical protein [unclassified Streptomyces]NMI60938.1 hypothetical protein [Streptomyces sp. RLA2-12]QDN70134.1 hypothetical protein FNV66_35550 [Streptomyces sp. S1D4-14]